MPPVQALVALHTFWVVLLVPPIVWVGRHGQPSIVRRLGCLLLTLASLGLVLLICREAIIWLPSVDQSERRYLGQRILFVLATMTDFPLVQLTLAGLVCWIVGKRRMPVHPAAGEPKVQIDGAADSHAIGGE